MNSHPFVPELDEVDYTDDYEEESDFDSASFNEMWIEYEGMEGEPIGTYDDDAWSTEESDADDSDDSMPDLEDIDDMDTSRTDAETHSDGGREAAVDQAPTNGLPPQKPRTEAPNLESPEHPTETDSEELAPFLVLDTPPPTNHYYINSTSASSSAFLKRIAKEHKILRSSLPPGILVRTWESRLDLIRVLMIGPADTPYEHAPFLIDFHLGSSYPSDPPEAFFHSWTTGTGPVNPNLYEDGKICLSLLGTWHADERNESWSSSKSTLLQVLVSIHSLVLNREPYYNEAGYDVHREAPETKLSSALYTERAYFRARGFIVHALTHPIDPFSQELVYLYLSKKEGAPQLLQKVITAAIEIIERSEVDDGQERDGLTCISRGAVVMLRRQVMKLEEIVEARKAFLAQGGGEDAAFVS
jgi:ubiquitin-conjugating enzyme E2 O